MRILAENTSCIVIDYQEKILPAMSGREELVANSAALLKGLNLLEIPMVLTTQYAKGLGNNIPEICPVSAEAAGRVRLDGVDWNARCATPGDTLAPGQSCRVAEIHSTLLIVEPVLTETAAPADH